MMEDKLITLIGVSIPIISLSIHFEIGVKHQKVYATINQDGLPQLRFDKGV